MQFFSSAETTRKLVVTLEKIQPVNTETRQTSVVEEGMREEGIDKEIEGKLVLVHADYFTGRKEINSYYLEITERGKRTLLPLQFKETVNPLPKDGTIVIISGKQNQNLLVVNTIHPKSQTPIDTDPGFSVVFPRIIDSLGQRRLAFIFVNFEDLPHYKPFLPEEIQEYTLGTDGKVSVHGLFAKASGSQMGIKAADIVGEITIPAKTTDCSQNRRQNFRVITDNYSFPPGYDAYVFVLANIESCGFNGMVVPQRKMIVMGWNESIIDTKREEYVFVLSHELGHLLGLGHSNSLYRCYRPDNPSQPVIVGINCAVKVYGDGFSSQSNTQGPYFPHSFYPFFLGWITDAKIERIDNSLPTPRRTINISQLVALESSQIGKKLIVIPRRSPFNIRQDGTPTPQNIQSYYYITYRKRIDPLFDFEDDAGGYYDGVSIHIGLGYFNSHTFLVDARHLPGRIMGQGAYDVNRTLLDNMSFYDELDDIRITQNSHNADNVNLTITIGEGS